MLLQEASDPSWVHTVACDIPSDLLTPRMLQMRDSFVVYDGRCEKYEDFCSQAADRTDFAWSFDVGPW